MDEFERVNREYFNKIAQTKKGNYQIEKSKKKLSTYIQNKNRKIILNCIDPKENILDLGCGNGEFTNQLSKLAATTAIDLSEEMISLAKTTFPHITFLISSIYQIPLETKSFNTTVCLNTLHHIKDMEKAISEICRVTKNQVLIEIKNKNSTNYLRRSLIKNPEYLWRATTIKEIKKMFSKNNFKLIKKYSPLPIINPVYILDFRSV